VNKWRRIEILEKRVGDIVYALIRGNKIIKEEGNT
jgi:hypothetical protein